MSEFPLLCLNISISCVHASSCREPARASRVLHLISSCMPRPVDSGGPPDPRQIGCFVWPSGKLKPSASATSLFRSCASTSGCAITPAAYKILCLRLAHLVRCPALQSNSAMGPRLDTGGWLTLKGHHYWHPSRQGLSPCKIRRALLGAITLRLTGATTGASLLTQWLGHCCTKLFDNC